MNEAIAPQVKKMSPQLLVKDISGSIAFYTNKLGFELNFFYEGFYAGVSKDGCSIHLKSGNPSTEERENKKENNDLDIIFSVSNVEELYTAFLKRPIEIIQPLCVQPYGKEFYITDPDGYILAFLEEH